MSNIAKIELKVDWSDLDAYGHVNNLAILRFFQTARIYFLEKFDLSPVNLKEGKGPIMAYVSGQFKKILHYPETITICTKIVEVKNTSFKMEHSILNEQCEIIAEGEDVVVYYDFVKNEKIVIPDELKIRLLGKGDLKF